MNTIDLTLDGDGYPTDETVLRVQQWSGKPAELLAAVRAVWRYADVGYWTEETVPHEVLSNSLTHRYSISTGGWSGNETLIGALQDNTMFWLFAWAQSNRGGHYIFEVPAGSAEATASRSESDLQDLLDNILHQAVASQYFRETHKHRAHLYDIMRRIDPKVADIFDDDPRKAFEVTAQRIGMEL